MNFSNRQKECAIEAVKELFFFLLCKEQCNPLQTEEGIKFQKSDKQDRWIEKFIYWRGGATDLVDLIYATMRETPISHIKGVKSGATRLALLFDTQSELGNVVVKIPYGKDDYCNYEVTNYRDAIDAGVDSMFAATDYCGDIFFIDEDDEKYFMPIYIMERAEVDESTVTESAIKQLEFYVKEGIAESLGYYVGVDSSSNEGVISSEVEEYASYAEEEELAQLAFESEYDEEDCAAFRDFLYENDINDIHLGNVGYVLTGSGRRLVCIDYAGFTL